MFCPSPRVPFAAGRTGGTGALIGPAWWLPSSSWLRSLEAFHYFMESVASPTSPYPSISIPRHRYMLNVLIICHFRLSALESSVYTETYASTLLFLGTPSIYSAELPTIPCYGLCVPCFHNSQVSFPILPVSFRLACAWWALPLPFCNEDAPRSLSEASHAWLCPPAFSVIHKMYFVSHV